jgi:hypothetical protein
MGDSCGSVWLGPVDVSRRERLVILLRWLSEAEGDGGGRVAGWIGGGPGSRMLRYGPLMAADEAGSFRRLRAALEAVGETHPAERTHLEGRYRGGMFVRRTVTWQEGCYRGLGAHEEVVAGSSSPSGRAGGSRSRPAPARRELVTVRVWPEWVSGVLAERGLGLLEERYVGEPVLPRCLVA